MKVDELSRQRILILGFGREGRSTYRFLRRFFPQLPLAIADRLSRHELPEADASLLACDPYLTLHLGESYLAALNDFSLIIKAPGIPAHLEEIERARADGVKFSSLTEIFFANCPSRIIGITGTKGKSTTAALITHLLAVAGLDVQLVGNIGSPALDTLTEPAAQSNKSQSWYVYELSSYQLEELTHSPHIAVFLNIFAEHLDHHQSYERYREAKSRITQFQKRTDYFVYNSALESLAELACHSPAIPVPFSLLDASALHDKGHPACYVQNGEIVFTNAGAPESVAPVQLIPLLGSFNINNALAAIAVAKLVGVATQTIQMALQSFEPLPHRLERVGTFRGITFYNAPLATIPEATMAHIQTLGESVHTVLLGGHDRHLDFTELGRFLVEHRIRELILFPTTGSRILSSVRNSLTPGREAPHAIFVDTMSAAVEAAYQLTPPGKTCLHSPASASFGLFRNYQERGDKFVECVKELSGLS